MSTEPNARSSAGLTGASAATRPRFAVITCTPAMPVGGRAKRSGVGQLPAEVESAEEAECLTQGHAPGLAEPDGQRKRCLVPEEERRALAAQVRR